MLDHESVEQHPTRVLELAQEDATAQVRALGVVLDPHPFELAVDGLDGMWEQAFETQIVSLLAGERRALVADGVLEQRPTRQRSGRAQPKSPILTAQSSRRGRRSFSMAELNFGGSPGDASHDEPYLRWVLDSRISRPRAAGPGRSIPGAGHP